MQTGVIVVAGCLTSTQQSARQERNKAHKRRMQARSSMLLGAIDQSPTS